MERRWYFAIASAVFVLAVVVVLAVGSAMSRPGLSTCGGTWSDTGKCVGIPMPGLPGATCVPQPAGSCSWFWEPGYPTD
jgi:hypothetical protein